MAVAIEQCAAKAKEVSDVDSFKNWIRADVRTVLPHGLSACVHGRIYGIGVSPDYVLTVDFPVAHLRAIRNASGHMDTPLASRWFETQQPVLFDGGSESGFPDAWVRNFREHDLRNAAANGVLDKESCIATYFSFHQLPELDKPVLRRTFEVLTPVLHETFARVIRLHEKTSCNYSGVYERLSEREREIAAYIAEGMSNGAIANVLAVSGNTVRNHVSRILEKTACGNRAGIARLVVQQAAKLHGMGPKVL